MWKIHTSSGYCRGRLIQVQNQGLEGTFNFVLDKNNLQCEKFNAGSHLGTCNNCNKPADQHLELWMPKNLNTDLARTLLLSFHSLKRSKESFSDFMNSYFTYHNLIPSEDFLHFLGILYFVEASIYQLDEENEESISSPKQLSESILNTLIGVLKQEEVYDELIEKEIKLGREYWSLERMLCSCPHRQINMELCDRAIKYKSFDYRILNLVLHKLRRKGNLTQSELDVLDFLKAYEVLIEIRDDLCDYEEDCRKNSFNIYRMFVKMHGTKMASSQLLSYIQGLENNYQTKLLKLPSTVQQKHLQHFRMSKGGMWIWDPPAAIPDEEPQSKPSVVPTAMPSVPRGQKLSADAVKALFFSATPAVTSQQSVAPTQKEEEVPQIKLSIDKRNLVSFYNMFQGGQLLQNFLNSYFRMYRIPFSSVLQHIDVLVWIESQIVQAQHLHERGLSASSVWDGIQDFLTLNKLMHTEIALEIELGRKVMITEQPEDTESLLKWLHDKSFNERLLHKLMWTLDPQFCIMTNANPFSKSATLKDYSAVLLEFVTVFETAMELKADPPSFLNKFTTHNLQAEVENEYKKQLTKLLPHHQQGHKDVLRFIFGSTEWDWKEFQRT